MCLSLRWATIRTSPVGIPNNWYQSTWFKVVFDFLLKNKSCQNCVLTIPLCRGGRDEATGENGVKIGRRKTAARAGEETAQSACHVSASQQTRQRKSADTSATVNRHIIDQSADTSAKWDPPATSLVASRAELEPSREPRDRIQCSWFYMQPDLRLNLSRWSGQNCFWSNLSRLKCDLDDLKLVSS